MITALLAFLVPSVYISNYLYNQIERRRLRQAHHACRHHHRRRHKIHDGRHADISAAEGNIPPSYV